jgi:hypothetical protein
MELWGCRLLPRVDRRTKICGSLGISGAAEDVMWLGDVMVHTGTLCSKRLYLKLRTSAVYTDEALPVYEL